jgi:hypothetical protein
MEEMVQRTVECRVCHRDKSINVPIKGYLEWCSGELIQNAMPSLSFAGREMLISRICGECWDKMFPDDDEDF